MTTGWNGLGVGLANVWRLADAETRSISPENPSGERGRGGMDVEGVASHANDGLGQGWKVSPYVKIAPGEEHVMADIEGSGAIQHIWLTPTGGWRNQILRMWWDDDPQPAVECPVGDFFACGWGEYAQVSSLAVCVNPGRAFNCYWEMPFQRRARITITNESVEERIVYYQVTYSLCDVPDDAARFCAQFRRVNPLAKGDVVTILDGVRGRGQYVGTYCAWGVNNSGWWGEGEVKFFLDGDDEFPTICGTGTEDLGHAGVRSGELGVLAVDVEVVRAAEVVLGAGAADGGELGVPIHVELDFAFAPPAGAVHTPSHVGADVVPAARHTVQQRVRLLQG